MAPRTPRELIVSDRYLLWIRRDAEESASSSCEELAERLLRVPTVVQSDGRHFVFAELDESGQVEIELVEGDDPATFSRVVFDVPRAWVPAKGPQVFALVFMTASWLAWEVYDPQIEDTLKKDVVLQGLVAMRRAQLESEGEK